MHSGIRVPENRQEDHPEGAFAMPAAPVRVLMVVRPAVGGMKEQMLALSRGIRDHGYEVELAGPAESLAEATDEGFIVHPVAIPGPLDPVRDPVAIAALARVVRGGRFDLVHAHGFKAGLIARVTRAFSRVPVVVTVHNHVLYRTEISAATKWRYVTVERLLASRAAAYITVSDSLRDELIDAYGLPAGKITTVHNGIDPAPFTAGQDADECREAFGMPAGVPVLGTACRFAPQKGLDDLIGALPEVFARVPNAVLVLGGDGPLAGELHAQAEAEGVADRILWPGMIADMPRFLAAIDVYVSSSRSEGLPLSLVETAAAGTPTVATRVGGTPEVVADGETGLLVESGDRHALADACVRLLEDRPEALRLSAAARERALSEFTPGVMVDRTLEVYERVLS